MKTSFKAISTLLICIIIATSCSRKKDNFVSRNYHAVTTEYNTLFNGYNALEDGRSRLNASYTDNYWEVLPIERMQIFEEITLPGQSKNENFTRAEEKAVKAIQKHSMNIGGKEKNPQIDEAYLLLGKSRYFDQRFVPSLEAFNYILYKYPASDKINQAKIWREKANIRLENDELAIKNLTRLLEQEKLSNQDLADATSMLAQAYLNTKEIDSAISNLEIASTLTKKDDERGRYRFIQGQLYNFKGEKDSANLVFDKVIELNRKTPRIYMISAYIEKAKNFNYDKGDKVDFLELLTDLEENRENRPFLDRIYHQKAEYFLNTDSDSLANVFYNKSLRTNSTDKHLKARNYRILGDMSFDDAQYVSAGAYYDSTMTNLKENSKPFRVIKRKRENLDDVILYEGIAKTNDSILHLVSLSDQERIVFFNDYIEKLKAEAERLKLEQEKAERNKGLAVTDNKSSDKEAFGAPGGKMIGPGGKSRNGPPGKATFYFYNQTTVSYGKNEFIKIWGDRELKDDWRWSKGGKSSSIKESILNNETFVGATEEELYTPDFYVSKIPSDQKIIDSISTERNFAYYQLGFIYKEKFKEYYLAKDKFQDLLKSNPEEKLIVPSKYNLYKIYMLLEMNGEADIVKNDIISNHPDSRYANILNNPELAGLRDENSPESLYENTYALFEKQEFLDVISNSDNYINILEGEDIVSKFELLKATAIGRIYGFEEYSKAINFVALNYPNSEEGKQAEQISNNVLSKLSSKEFVQDSLGNNFKIVYQFKLDQSKQEEIDKFAKKLKDLTENTSFYDITTSVDTYNPTTKLVVLHGLKSSKGAEGFAQLLNEDKRNKISRPYFIISSVNYQVIQIHKNLDLYFEYQQ